MKDSSINKQANLNKHAGKKGKQFTVIRNFNGSLTAEEFVSNLMKAGLKRENQKQRGGCDEI